MHLVISPNGSPANTNDYPLATRDPSIVTDVEAVAANDCATGQTRRHALEVNALVGRVVGHVMSKQPAGPTADVQLVMAPGRHLVQSDPVALSFALSGILAAQMSSVDEGGSVTVATAADTRGVRVTISTDDVPPLAFVRAISGDGDSQLGDPTLAHCRRLVEEQGGSVGLVEQDGRIALCIAFPPVLPSNVVPLGSSTLRQPGGTTSPLLVA